MRVPRLTVFIVNVIFAGEESEVGSGNVLLVRVWVFVVPTVSPSTARTVLRWLAFSSGLGTYAAYGANSTDLLICLSRLLGLPVFFFLAIA